MRKTRPPPREQKNTIAYVQDLPFPSLKFCNRHCAQPPQHHRHHRAPEFSAKAPGASGPLPRAAPVFLDLLGAPAGVGLPHVGGRLDGGDELEDDVAHTDKPDDGAGDDAQHAVVQQDGAHEDVEGAAPDEGEEEGGVARDLRRDLELEEAGGYRPVGGGCQWEAGPWGK